MLIFISFIILFHLSFYFIYFWSSLHVVLVSPVLRVSEAARTGDVPELKRVLDAETITKRDFLLKTRTDGATPLIIAARNGNTAIVQCLLDEYDVDLEQEGTVKIDGDLIECCTPLWMGSLGGHLAIVRLLLERGAEVNHTTLTNSTPLRAASFNGHTEVCLISRLRVHIQLKNILINSLPYKTTTGQKKCLHS